MSVFESPEVELAGGFRRRDKKNNQFADLAKQYPTDNYKSSDFGYG